MSHAATALAALAVDAVGRELPNRIHPVVAIGKWFALGERLAPSGDAARLAWGGAWLGGGMTVAAAVASLAPRHPLVAGPLAKTLLAYGALDRAVAEVQHALERHNLAEARRLLGWHLVSRPTADLSAAEVAAAAIESLAENLSDSVVAPVGWLLAGGLPALAAYRCTNTADAMWGYHSERFEFLGKVAARTDDLANWVPARVTVLLLALGAQATNGRGAAAWRMALAHHGRTASPNAGWPMAAMAGALDTTLTKVGHYSLGTGTVEPTPALIAMARRIARRALLAGVAGLAFGAVAQGASMIQLKTQTPKRKPQFRYCSRLHLQNSAFWSKDRQ